MEFLKALFDKPLTFEELQAKLKDNKEIKLVNLMDGKYVDKDKFDKAELKSKELQSQLDTTKETLKSFEGVDVKELQGKVTTLTETLAKKDTEYQGKIADMEFNSLIESAIGTAKGKNAKAIKALLDVETLKTSKNQAEDIKQAIISAQKENPYLFGEDKNPPPGNGEQSKPSGADTLSNAISEHYKQS